VVKPDRIYTVSEVTKLVKQELEGAFPFLWVEGEISNFHRHVSGHLYFTLKDKFSQLRAVLFRFEARKVVFEMKDGLQVHCRGRLNVYEPRGEYQLVVELVEPKGKGALQLAFEQLKERLRAEGLFEEKHKKKLPLLPKKIGVVTSPKGAAIVDILKTLERRFARLHILIYPVRVQGEGAAEEIVEGIDYLGKLPGVDVLIVGRGGGSMEDLWAFNEEKVARAIFRSPVPVISAVGHEVDFTIADFVADIRASTPTAAAELVVEKEQSFREQIETLREKVAQRLKIYLQERKQKIILLAHDKAFQNFERKLLGLEQKVDDLEMRAWNILRSHRQGLRDARASLLLQAEKMRGLLRECIQSRWRRWESASVKLHTLSPLNILKKGYALCWGDGGRRLIRTIQDIQKGQSVSVTFSKGEFSAEVVDVDRMKRIESRFSKEAE
jgi:exodeoxyribonuclease VII large subunit